MASDKKNKKKKNNKLRQFILNQTGASDVIRGLEGGKKKKKSTLKKRPKPRDTRGMVGMRLQAGQSAKRSRRKKKK